VDNKEQYAILFCVLYHTHRFYLEPTTFGVSPLLIEPCRRT